MRAKRESKKTGRKEGADSRIMSGIKVFIIAVSMVIIFLGSCIALSLLSPKGSTDLFGNAVVIERSYSENNEGRIPFLYKYPSSNALVKKGKYPVIILLHGSLQTSHVWFDGLMPLSNGMKLFRGKAIDSGYVIISADSGKPWAEGKVRCRLATLCKTWNHGDTADADAPKFADIFAWIQKQPNLDSSRIYFVGFSSGAFMTSRLMITYPDKIKAGAIHSGVFAEKAPITNGDINLDVTAIDTSRIPNNHPPTIFIHADQDPRVDPKLSQYYLEALLNKKPNAIYAERYSFISTVHYWNEDYNDEILNFFNKYN